MLSINLRGHTKNIALIKPSIVPLFILSISNAAGFDDNDTFYYHFYPIIKNQHQYVL